jgi:hypothetical protein
MGGACSTYGERRRVCRVLVAVGRPADIRLRRTTRTNCHIYTLLSPDDGLIGSPKHVEVWRLNKLEINSASNRFHYTHISRRAVYKT